MWLCSAKWKKFARKHSFYDELKGEWDMYSTGDLAICLGDFNGHVGRYIDGFSGQYGLEQKNLEGRMLLEFCLEKELCVSYTWSKREE